MVVVAAMVCVRGVIAGFTVFMVVVPMVMPVVVVMRVGAQEIGVDVEFGVQVEAAQVKKVLDRHIAKVHRVLWCARVHVL